ncbi:MAG: DUF4416 family protein [Fidelibacterota bacterium]
MKPQEITPVKYFIGALHSSTDLLEKSLTIITKHFSPIDLMSEDFLFEGTDYYELEMGSPIYRRIFSLEQLEDPLFLADAKLICNDIEDELAINGKRKVNLDVGYIDFNKVVLGSAKYCANKIYIGKGIWADPALQYSKGKFSPYPWAFMDFKRNIYYDFIMQIRIRYKHQLQGK